MRIKLVGWYSAGQDTIRVEGKGWHKTIDRAYVTDEKIKEMEENGYAYTNKDKSLLV